MRGSVFRKLYLLGVGLGSLALFMSVTVTLLAPQLRGPATEMTLLLARQLGRTLEPQLSDPAALCASASALADQWDVDVLVQKATGDVVCATHPTLEPLRNVATREPGAFIPLLAPTHGAVILGRGTSTGAVLFRPRNLPTVAGVPVRMLVLVSLTLLLFALVFLPLALRLGGRIQRLLTAADQLGAGNLGARTGLQGDDELAQVARSFDGMAARIEEMLARERQMVATISHELRTPLTRMRFLLELMETHPPERRAALEQQLLQMDRLLGKTLWHVRLLSADKVSLEPVALLDVLERCRDAALTGRPDRSVELDVPPDIFVDADETLLERALENLLENALKYDPSLLPVRVEVSMDNATVTLRMLDSGPGIPAELKELVFEPFQRGAASRGKASGFGLGLSIARRVATVHGGTLRATDRTPRGTCMEMTLPASRAGARL